VKVRRGVVAGQHFGIADQGLDAFGKTRQVADDAKADVVLVQPGDLVLQRTQEQFHQQGDFVLRASPVFGTEGKHGEMRHAALATGTDNAT